MNKISLSQRRCAPTAAALPRNHPRSPGDPTWAPCRKYAFEASKSHSHLLPRTERLTAARQGYLVNTAEPLKKRQEIMGGTVVQNTSEHISTTYHHSSDTKSQTAHHGRNKATSTDRKETTLLNARVMGIAGWLWRIVLDIFAPSWF